MKTHDHRTRDWFRARMIAYTVPLSLFVAATVSAEDMRSPAEAVRPFVSETTALVLRVDTARLRLPPLERLKEAMTTEVQAGYQGLVGQGEVFLRQVRDLVNSQPVYATVGIPISQSRIAAFAFVETPPGDRGQTLIGFLKGAGKVEAVVHGDYVVTTPVPRTNVEQALALAPPKDRPEIASAFASVAEFPVQLLLVPPAYIRQTITELLPELPKQLGGGSSTIVTEGLQWAAFGADPGTLRAKLVIQSASESAAKRLALRLPQMARSAYEAAPQLKNQIPPDLFQSAIGTKPLPVEGNRIVLTLGGDRQSVAHARLLGLLATALDQYARRSERQNKFKQLLLGIHNYFNVYRSLPPASQHRDQNGKPLLSWRVHILPFVEQQGLYEQFHLHEPWDSEHNKKLLTKMPAIYSNKPRLPVQQTASKPGYTTFLAPVGKGTVMGGSKPTKFSDIRDGTSNTVILVEVSPDRAVPWTAPDDFRFEAKDPGKGLAVGPNGLWLCALCDGSVHMLQRTIPAESILHLFQMADGHPVDLSKY